MTDLVLTSDRLRMIPFTIDDLDICLELFTDPEVVKYADGVLSEASIRKGMPAWSKRGDNGCIGIWCITDRHSEEKYGSVALLPIPIEEDDTDFSLVIPGVMPEGDIEIGYFLKRSAWGRGYATEAAVRLLEFAFLESPLGEVVATIEEENVSSHKVLMKAGFTLRGTRRCYGEDGPDYRITRDEWSKRQHRDLR